MVFPESDPLHNFQEFIMKIYLIKASAPGPFKDYKRYMGAPPQSIFAAAAATPKGVEIDMCDETSGMKVNMHTDADIVFIFMHTPDAFHGYTMADKFRSMGKTVVLGGLHVNALPYEAAAHGDAIIVGQQEHVWTQILMDHAAGELKPRYEDHRPVDMATLNPYPTNIITPWRYYGVWSVMVSRGCVNRCEYCVIPPFFRNQYRVRPVEDVVAEIKKAPANWFELHVDNLTADREYAVALFKALKPLKINWLSQATIQMADDPELLKLAKESGCRYLLVGIETPSQAALSKANKQFVDPNVVRDNVRRFQDHGIQISSSMVFGFDGHTPDIFEESADFSKYVGLDEVTSVILCPFPGTPLYKRLHTEGRLLTYDWAKYDCANVVFQPQNMSPQKLETGAAWFADTFSDQHVFSTTSYAKWLTSRVTKSFYDFA